MKPNVIPIQRSASACVIETAMVMGIAEDSVMIETEAGLVNAGVAFGCLVAPEAGDKVLVSRSERECYVLSVLERPSRRDMILDFPGHVRLNAPVGGIDLASGKDLNLLAAGKTRMLSAETQIGSAQVVVNADKITARVRDFESHVQSARIFADAIDTVAKRISQSADTVMRWVEGLETLNIGNLVQTVRKALISHSTQTVLTAKKDVLIDGERIHMG